MGAGATAAEVPSVSALIMHAFAVLYARHAGDVLILANFY